MVGTARSPPNNKKNAGNGKPKPASPKVNPNKKKGFTIKGGNKMNSGKKNRRPVVVFSFAGPEGTGMEFYIFARNEDDMNDFYTWFLVDYMIRYENGTLQSNRHPDFENGGFTRLYSRRIPNSANRAMTQIGQAYWRKILGRDVSGENGDGTSTPETRAEGFRILHDFLTDTEWVQYQPDSGFIHRDITSGNSPVMPMCKSLMDMDIREIMELQFDASELDETFYGRFQNMAPQIWDPTTYEIPDFARQLGYPQDGEN